MRTCSNKTNKMLNVYIITKNMFFYYQLLFFDPYVLWNIIFCAFSWPYFKTSQIINMLFIPLQNIKTFPFSSEKYFQVQFIMQKFQILITMLLFPKIVLVFVYNKCSVQTRSSRPGSIFKLISNRTRLKN